MRNIIKADFRVRNVESKMKIACRIHHFELHLGRISQSKKRRKAMKKFGLILSFFAFVMLFGCTQQEPAETQKQKR
jgi:hypothetical protein